MRTIRILALAALASVSFAAHGSRIGGQVVIDGVDSQCSNFVASTSGGSSVYTCTPSSTAPGAPTGCIATVNSAAAVNFSAAGGTANLAVSCTQTSGVSYNWRRNGVTGASTLASWSDVLPANGGGTAVIYNYQVAACISSACVTVPSSALTATVAASGSFSGSCPGFDTTIALTLNWGSPVRVYTGHMGPNDMVLVQFTTGNTSTTSSLVRIAGAEYNSPPSSRIATLSTTPCDFTTQGSPGSNIGPTTSVTASFAITPGSGFGYYAVLAKNSVFYLSIKNSSPTATTCAATGECSMFFDLVKPSGL